MRVYVTGGSGSIGKEVARAFIARGDKVHISGLSEARMAEAIRDIHPASWSLTDMRTDYFWQELAWTEYDLIVHCAAMKHVPLCEKDPMEAAITNVHGTTNVILGAELYGAHRVLVVSSDKACAPHCVMGYTKALAESFVRTSNFRTDVVGVRLGNIFPSAGNVFEIWEKQAKAGGPITVTDPDMTRFFFHVSRAVDLIMETAQHARRNEIRIPRMRSVRMGDLASVFAEHYNVDVSVIGARPGEKKHELLISEDEIDRVTPRQYYYTLRPDKGRGIPGPVRSDQRPMTKSEIQEMFFDSGL